MSRYHNIKWVLRYLNTSVGSPHDCFQFRSDRLIYNGIASYIVYNPHTNNPSVETLLNPLSPHDALKHHFTSLTTDLILVQQSDL